VARNTVTRQTADPDAGYDEFAKSEDTQDGEVKEARTRRVKDTGEETVIGEGWSSDKRASTSGGKIPAFKVPDEGEEILFKFIQERPFAPFWQHWLRGRQGKQNFVCIAEPKKGTKPEVRCPLCDIGDVPKSADYFNVIDLSDPANPVLKVWYASADPAKAIRERSEVKRTSPINREDLYFVASKRKGKNGFPSYSVDPVKASDLPEDWDMEPLTADVINEFIENAYTKDIVKPSSRRELEILVEELDT